MTVLSADSSSTKAMYHGDTLVILPNVNLYVSSDDAITGQGSDTLRISGNVYSADYGFHDTTALGFDSIVVAPSGSVIADSSAFRLLSGGNSFQNSGYIFGYWAVYCKSGRNYLGNSGEISSSDTTIEFDDGSNTIENFGKMTNT